MKKLNINEFAAIGELKHTAEPPKTKNEAKIKEWKPKLNRGAQIKLYESKAKNILAWSEKGSGKTHVIIHKLVKHCIDNQNALAIILVPTKSMANKGGAWDELKDVVLPQWNKYANVEYTDVQKDEQHNSFIWIRNKFGGWSQVFLISCPYGSQLKDRMPGGTFSFVFVDELDKADSDEYYKAVAAQVGRRRGILGENQQYIAACNPKGPSHWIYLTWFVDAFDDETGEWDADYEQIHCPALENEHNLPKGYFEHLKKVYKRDPVESSRLLGGEWLDRPSGDAMFADLYVEHLHVRPLQDNLHPDLKRRIRPNAEYPVLLGIDSGATHHSFTFAQQLPVDGKLRYVVFDEVVVLKKKVTYARLMPVLMRRFKFWLTLVGPMPLVAISDASAFNVFRPGSLGGSFDFLDMEKEWNLRATEIGVPRLKIKPCPKFNDSVSARVRCLQNALANEQIIISSCCPRHQQMMRLLESEKQKVGKEFDPELAMKPRRSNHLHVFDSLTYIMLMGALSAHQLKASGDSRAQKLITVQ